jgi:hypothetical protein
MPLQPPQAPAYAVSRPGVVVSYGRTLAPISFFANSLGASAGKVGPGRWRIIYFGHEAELYPYQKGALLDGKAVTLPAAPQIIRGQLYVPLAAIADFLEIGWKRVSPPSVPAGQIEAETKFLLTTPAAYIESVRAQSLPDRTRLVLTLSNPTRIVASQNGTDTRFFLAAARRADVPSTLRVSDYLLPRVTTQSGNWRASVATRTNYTAPVRWFTMGNPSRLVVEYQKLFEETSTRDVGSGLSLSKIRKAPATARCRCFWCASIPGVVGACAWHRAATACCNAVGLRVLRSRTRHSSPSMAAFSLPTALQSVLCR